MIYYLSLWSKILTDKSREKGLILDEVEAVLDASNYTIVESDKEKPWGAYFKIDRDQTKDFLEEFFSSVNLPSWAQDLELDPKILVVAPEKRLSWQYHKRRGEVWTVVTGPVGIYVSDTDEQPENPKVVNKDGNVQIQVTSRHRLAGLDSWGIVAEIWVHTDKDNPSNEEDIVRVEDDFGR